MIFLQFLAFLLWITPRWLVESACYLGGCFFYDIIRLRRKLVDKNIERALAAQKTPAERQEIARQSYASTLLTLLEFILSTLKNPSLSVTMHNHEQIRSYMQSKVGVYILGVHMGNFETMGSAINTLIGPAHTVVKKVGPNYIDNLILNIRRRNGFRVIKKGAKGAAFRQLMEALARGESIGYVADQARPGEPKLIFFGEPALTNTTIGRMWLRHRGPIIPTMVKRVRFGQHELHFFEEVDTSFIKPESSDSEITLGLAERSNRVSEMLILKCPEQYFWFHNRWK